MIRLATPGDLQGINKIYNQAVADGLRTAHTEPTAFQEREGWFHTHDKESHPIFVYEKHQQVLGWLSISAYRSDRQALNDVIEISYYVDYAHHGQGIGSKLMGQGLQVCQSAH